MSQLIGIQGSKASYHEQAALRLHPQGTLQYYATFHELFDALRAGDVDSVVCAVSNTIIGSIAESDIELRELHDKYVVLRKIELPIAHSLLGVPGATLTGIQNVYSQRPALEQCQKSLARLLPNAHLVETEDTALSARLVAESNSLTKAAIASAAAGALYGLVPLITGFQDDQNNITSFVEIALI